MPYACGNYIFFGHLRINLIPYFIKIITNSVKKINLAIELSSLIPSYISIDKKSIGTNAII